jgi:SagB-type dehydrogenase family enzyme
VIERLTDVERVYRYHDGTKHHFERFARSLGYLDWASQPRPFRSFDGAPVVSLFPSPTASGPGIALPGVSYDGLFGESPEIRLPITAASLGYFLRCSLGLSAWKVFRGSRWSLRVNPSSGNLHPTEAYIVSGPGVWHYAPDRHVIEQRCVFDPDAWRIAGSDQGDVFLVALASIHWRESWKYGERAFRYCQHDLGHALAAVALSAALCGWRATLLPGWAQRDIAALVGVDRDEDYVEAEREEAACLVRIARSSEPQIDRLERADPVFLDSVRNGRWFGRASQLSEDHVQWTFIDEIARATEDPGRAAGVTSAAFSARPAAELDRGLDAAQILLQRRSAVAFDGRSFAERSTFERLLARTLPSDTVPWRALWWSPRIHLAIFVHRVDGVAPGLYLLSRAAEAVSRLQAAFRSEFAWTKAADDLPLWLLQTIDCRSLARRLSCDQDIAADGFFSLGMIADFAASLDEHGPSFYRHLFWEAGVVGQIVYLEAEAAGARATGIGCFYDDPVHKVLGIEGHAFQSLYHFTVGMPVEDARLTTERGYGWET